MSTHQEVLRAAAYFAGLARELDPSTTNVSVSFARFNGEETILTTLSVSEQPLTDEELEP